MDKNHKIALRTLCITVFMLLAVPRMNMKIGPIPFYFIDVFLLATFLFAGRLQKRKDYFVSYARAITIIMFFATVSEVYAITEIGTIVQPLYQIFRTLLAASIFFSAVRIIRDKNDLTQVLKFALLGSLVTASLLILSSLPLTRNFSNNYIFSIQLFEPSYKTVVEHYSQYYGAMRGRSYVGVSILSGAFLNSIWPVLLYLGRFRNITGIWKVLLRVASFLIPISVVMTYSRGAVLGLVFVILSVLILNVGEFRRALIFSTGLALLMFIYIGFDSELFYFQRLENSTTRVIEQPVTDYNETERLYAYTEPFEHLVTHPQFLLFGKGLSFLKADSENYGFERNYADHAVFAKAYYSYGMISAFTYVFLLLTGMLKTFNIIKTSKGRLSVFSKVAFVCLMGFLPWFMLGHAAVSSPRGATLAFFIFGLVAIQQRMNISSASENDKS